MVPQPLPVAASGPAGSDREPSYIKVRIRFRKAGALRLLSHHDLLRCFERMLRRAELRYRTTAGFNPKPRLVFASALPLGVVGCEEVVELELDEERTPEDIQARLTRQAPAGLEFLAVKPIAPRTTAHVAWVTYAVALPSDSPPSLLAAIAALLASANGWVERTRPEKRRIDVRPYLRTVRLLDQRLEMDLTVTPQGTARPDEVLELLGLRSLLDAGAVLERTRLVLEDEVEPAGGTSCR